MTKREVTPIFDNEDVVNTICDPGGTDLAVEFINSLDDRDAAIFRRYFQYLHQGARIKSPYNMRHISQVADRTGGGAEVHELKIHRNGGLRLYVVKFGDRWYATHGRKKPKDSKVPAEARKALAIFYGSNS